MRVKPTPLPDLEIVALVALESDDRAGIYEGEVVAYRCLLCGAADETLRQVYHEETDAGEECPYTGLHGRTLYEAIETVQDGPCLEFAEEHPIEIIRMGEHNRHEGKHRNEPLGFRCPECGNADIESTQQIINDLRHVVEDNVIKPLSLLSASLSFILAIWLFIQDSLAFPIFLILGLLFTIAYLTVVRIGGS